MMKITREERLLEWVAALIGLLLMCAAGSVAVVLILVALVLAAIALTGLIVLFTSLFLWELLVQACRRFDRWLDQMPPGTGDPAMLT